MTDLMTLSSAQLLIQLNNLRSGDIIGNLPAIKLGTYSKGKMIEMITAYEATILAAAPIANPGNPAKVVKVKKPEPKKIEAIDPDDLDTEEEEFFTMVELANHMGINPKIARARYRALDNDKVPTDYQFEKTKKMINKVALIISPKR